MPDTNTLDTQHLPVLLRAAQIEPSTFDESTRTVEVVFSTGAQVRRFDWARERMFDEELVISPDAVNLARMNAGASVLNSHGQYDLRDVIGVVERAWLNGPEARASIRLSERPELAGIVTDIQSGIIRHISAGYSTEAIEMVPPEQRTDGGKRWLYRATRWTPAEISFVPIPADAGSGTRNQPTPGAEPCIFTTRAAAQTLKAPTMPESIEPGGAPATPQPAAPIVVPDTRAADIADLCTRHGVPTLTAGLIRNGATIEAAGLAVLAELAHRDAASGGHRNVAHIETVQDEMVVRMAGIEQAILHRVAAATKLDDSEERIAR